MSASFPKELFEGSAALEGNQWTLDALSGLGSCKGILLFADQQQQPIQLLQSGHLRRTAQARLVRTESSPAARKTDLSSCTKRVFYRCCYNDFETHLQLLGLAHAIGGKTEQDIVRLPKTSFAVLDLDAPLPYFYVSPNSEHHERRKAWGLFPSSKAAQAFCRNLNTVFCLCLNPSLLQTGNEASCPYLQMHQCPGPCLNRIPRQVYMDQVHRAIRTADGDIDSAVAVFTAEMKRAALDKRFEQAQLFKEKIKLLGHLHEASYYWTENLDHFSVLHIDRGPRVHVEGLRRKQQQFSAWKITSAQVYDLGSFTLCERGKWEQAFAGMWTDPPAARAGLTRQERFGLLSLMLYRSRVQGLWVNTSQGIPIAGELFEKLSSLEAENTEDASASQQDQVAPYE